MESQDNESLSELEKTNAKQFAGRFFCKHMKSGVAGGYINPTDGKEERLFINDDGIKALSPTFEGKPVFVDHQEVNLATLQEDADGFVVKSFYNEKDGWWWAEFIAISDKAHEAIRSGCGVSNAYIPTEYAEGDQHIGVDYDAKVLSGYFTHLAIVPNPRYEESIILTPDQFKDYQDKKASELRNISNSKTTKGANFMSLIGKIFKTGRTEVTNELPADTDLSTIEIEQDGKTYVFVEKTNAAKKNEDESKDESDKEKLNESSAVTYEGKETTLGELMNRFKKSKKNSDDSDEDDVENEGLGLFEKGNTDEEGEDLNEEGNKEKKNSHFDRLMNADKNYEVENSAPESFEGSAERSARAKRLFSI